MPCENPDCILLAGHTNDCQTEVAPAMPEDDKKRIELAAFDRNAERAEEDEDV